jgi:hypothetical protein
MTESQLLFVCDARHLPVGGDGNAEILGKFLESANERRVKRYLGNTACLYFWNLIQWDPEEYTAHHLLYEFAKRYDASWITSSMFSFMRVGAPLNDVEQLGTLTDAFSQKIERTIKWG